MATAITIQDIMDAIDAEPEMLDALRARLLTRELMELPEKFAAFQAETAAFHARTAAFHTSTAAFQNSMLAFQDSMRGFQRSTLAFQKSMVASQEATDARLDDMDTRFDGVDRRFDDMDRRFDGVDTRLDGMDRHFAHLDIQVNRLNGWVASRTGVEEVPFITDNMGYRYRRTLERVELFDMTYDCDTSDIRQGDLDSFKRADAVAETTDGEGRKRYVAIEISHTARKRDTDRAIRNARFIARFTGVPASAAVAGIQMADEIRDAVDAGDVFWHELPMSVLQPE